MSGPGALPSRLGPYTVLGLVAKGGMATVLRAIREGDTEPVALKVPHLGPSRREQREQLRREVAAMARLAHPHVLPVLGFGEEADGTIWLALPFVPHADLKRYARGASIPAIVERVGELLTALAYIHDRRILHRDLKPSNLLVRDPAGAAHLLVADFGIASLEDKIEAEGQRVRGTIGYMSPEQIRGEPLGPASDLYSVGVTLYEIFEGRRPFGRRVLEGIARGQRGLPPVEFPEDEAPELLRPILRRLLAEDPLDRYPSASALLADLLRLAPGLPSRRLDRPAFVAGAAEQATKKLDDLAPLVCPTCGTNLPPTLHCPRCERAGSVTGTSGSLSTGTQASTSLSKNADRRAAVLAVRDGATIVGSASALHRSGAHVEVTSAGFLIATLGTLSAQGHEVPQLAELALALRRMAGALPGAAIAVGRVSLGEGRIAGDAVVTATELAASAPVGEILLSPEASEGLSARFHLADGPARLLGVRALARPGSLLVGREREIAAIDRAIEAAERAGAAGTFLVAGPPGMGKSTILRHVVSELAQRPGWRVLSGVAAAADRAAPLGTLIATVREWAGLHHAAPIDARARLLGELLAGAPDPEHDRDLAAILGDALEPGEREALPGGNRARDFEIFRRLFTRLGELGPVALVIDDLQLADDATAGLLRHLAERPSGPLLLVVGARETAWASGAVTTLVLAPLDPAASRAVVDRALGGGAAWPPELERSLATALSAVGGHPYFLYELGRLAAARLAAGLGPPPEVTSIEELLRLRLHELSPLALRTVELAATIGLRFWPALVTRLLEAELPEGADPLGELAGLGWFEPVEPPRIPGLVELRFTHALMHELARSRVSAERARIAHARTAAWLERHVRHLDAADLAELADHQEAAGERARAAAIHARIGAMAEVSGALAEAARSYDRALALAEAGGEGRLDLPGLWMAAARTHLEGGAIDRAERLAARALDAGQPERLLLLADAHRVLAEVARSRSETDRALAHLDRGLAVLGPSGDPILRALLLARRGWILGYILGRNAEGRADARLALSLVGPLDVPAIESHIYSFLGANELRAGEWDRQLECNQRALALARRARDPVGQARAHINLSVCFTNRGELATAGDHASQAIELSRRGGMVRSEVVAVNNLGMIRLDQGRLDEAEALLEECVVLSERHGQTDVLHETLPTWARARLARRDLAGAERLLTRGLELARGEGNTAGIALGLRVLAQVRMAEGRRADAEAELGHALAALGAEGDRYELAQTELCLALLTGADPSSAEAALRSVGADVALEHRRWSPPTG